MRAAIAAFDHHDGQRRRGPVAALEPASPENRQVLPTFNYATVEPVLTAVGARFVRQGHPTAQRCRSPFQQ
jgi:hypothetical protein